MGELIERDDEVRAVADLLTGVVQGRGGSVLFAGSAGIGKSALALHAHESARRRGFAVPASSPTPVSAVLIHGVVRDWFGPLVRGGRPGRRPFDGPAAALAHALTSPGTHPEVWSLARLDYAVTWALENLAEQQPVLLLVDDAQWADQGSLQLLDLLSARLDRAPLGLVLTMRAGEPTQTPGILERLSSRALVIEPPPLSVRGVEQLQSRATDPAARSAPAKEVHRLTGGVPFLVAQMLRARGDGVTPQPVVDSVRSRLDQLGEVAGRVARTVAHWVRTPRSTPWPTSPVPPWPSSPTRWKA